MTEKETIMPKDAPEETAERVVWDLCDKFDKALFEKFDQLHTKGINDGAVIRALRKGGYSETASAYIEWADCIDPDAEGNETLDTVIPDPTDAPSYAGHPLNRPAAPPAQEPFQPGPDMPGADDLLEAIQWAAEQQAKPSVPSVEDQLEGVARIREAHAKTFGAARGEVQWP